MRAYLLEISGSLVCTVCSRSPECVVCGERSRLGETNSRLIRLTGAAEKCPFQGRVSRTRAAREAVFCRPSAGASGSQHRRPESSIFQRLYYSKFGFFVQAAVCPACGTKTAAPPQKAAESAMKPPFFCHAGVTKNFSARTGAALRSG